MWSTEATHSEVHKQKIQRSNGFQRSLLQRLQKILGHLLRCSSSSDDVQTIFRIFVDMFANDFRSIDLIETILLSIRDVVCRSILLSGGSLQISGSTMGLIETWFRQCRNCQCSSCVSVCLFYALHFVKQEMSTQGTPSTGDTTGVLYTR